MPGRRVATAPLGASGQASQRQRVSLVGDLACLEDKGKEGKTTKTPVISSEFDEPVSRGAFLRELRAPIMGAP